MMVIEPLHFIWNEKAEKVKKILKIFHKMRMGKFENNIELYFQVSVKNNQLPGV